MAAITHAKSLTMGDTSDTSVVRPSDWNSGHQFIQTISGNTTGQNTASGTNLVYGFTGGVTGSLATAANAATLWVDGGAPVTAYTTNNRQLGASSHINPGNNNVWISPIRLPYHISASSLAIMMTYTGTITSAATARFGQSLELGVYLQNATDATRYDTIWTAGRSITLWVSGTSSNSYDYGGTTSSSAASNLIVTQVWGMRQHTFTIGSILDPGFYLLASRVSTSSAGFSALCRTYNAVIDNPVPAGGGTFGQATVSSSGYVDGGIWSATSNALPASIGIGEIRQSNNQMPYFKIGAL